MKLRFHENEIKDIAKRYKYPWEESELIELRKEILKKGCLNKKQLQLVAKWKAPRSAGHVKKNTNEYVKDITAFAFSTKDERSRIEVLTVLDGVSWPTASVLLHLFHKEPYPILDFRALWSASLDVPKQYTFSFWQPYVLFCREISKRNKVSMRVLDRAMWQYSKENQRVSSR
jgi:hypothetical protein